jgi:signal transduction histidine kinase
MNASDDDPARHGFGFDLKAAAWLAFCYPVLVAASLALKPAIPITGALYPPIALEYSAFLLTRRNRWPWIALLASTFDLLVMPVMTIASTGKLPALWYSLVLSLITSLTSLGMALMVRAFRLDEHDSRSMALAAPSLMLVLPLGALPGCLLTTWLHAQASHQPFVILDVAIRSLAASLSVIALCPLVLGFLRGFDEPIRAAAGARERFYIGCAFLGLCVLYFLVPWTLDRFLELMLLAGPLLWVSLRCSQRAVAIVCAAVALGIGFACAHGIGRFPPLIAEGTWRDGILSAQMFLLIVCGESLLINRIVLKQRALLEDSKRKQVMLAAYGKALDEAEDAARRAAASDLHDGVAQIIAGQSMILGALRRRMPETPLCEMVDQAIAASREAQSAVRATIDDLSPPEVDRASPQEILTWLTEFFAQRYRFDVQWRMTGDPADSSHSRLVYRAVRELVYNAYKHSQADTVRVALCMDGTGTRLSVSDDGVGFDPKSAALDCRHHHGLSHLAERVSVVSGYLDIDAATGQGCTITVFLPAQQSASLAMRPAWEDSAGHAVG